MNPHNKIIADKLGIKEQQVAATAALLDDGATVPFIARYRKEATGLLDEMQIAAIRDQMASLIELDKRRAAIIASLAERGLLSEDLQQSVRNAANLASLEDIYLPFRPKRRTRSMIAQERGLEPLAKAIFAQNGRTLSPEQYINTEQEINSVDDALTGARDIIAEWINEDKVIRASLRKLFARKSLISSKLVKKNEEKGAKFRDYFQWQEPIAKTPGHRLLAMFRGENEKVLNLSVRPEESDAMNILQQHYIKRDDFSGKQVSLALADSYKRLLAPSLENELRTQLKDKADQEAIAVFAENLKGLLLTAPLGRKRVMALDPGFRTGAKLVCLDQQGQLLENTTIFPTHSAVKIKEAEQTVRRLADKYDIEAIAIGNGTAGRETEAFIRSLGLGGNIIITMVDESGASIYSASDAARKEFPEHDVTVRGAISIGRRLQDPLSELVKIDPKAIGVGQYQHDVNQAQLKKGLEDVVINCVNSVGVEVNTASMELLTFVSGLGPTLAANIIKYRNEQGPFSERKELLKVGRLGAKAYEQCAGFLRIHGAKNPLDASAVHPEHYETVNRMAKDGGCSVLELVQDAKRRDLIDLSRYVTETAGVPTLNDIMAELAKPGRDPRAAFTRFSFTEGINRIEDLAPGMKLPGIVTNVTKFGAFVDIGVHQDGLVHISQLANRFVKDPAEVVSVRQQVEVRVLEIDLDRKRISLSLKDV